jgi:hypothetical protein
MTDDYVNGWTKGMTEAANDVERTANELFAHGHHQIAQLIRALELSLRHRAYVGPTKQ